MRFNKLDLNQLVVLNALLTEQSVKKAADKIFLSPAATSCALARLRNYFEDELLIQVGKTMVLSPKAESLQQPVHDVLLQIQAITTINPTYKPETSTRKITIGASDYVINVFLSEVIKRVSQLAPLMQFDLRLIGLHSHAELENGEIDMLITPDFFTLEDHPMEPLFEDSWSCVIWDGNDDISDNLSLEQYLESGHIDIKWGAGRFGSSIDNAAKKLGYNRRHEVVVPNFSVMPQLLIGTSRIASIQTRMAQQLVSVAPLRMLPCPLPIQNLQEIVQWNKYQNHDPALTWFKGILKHVSADMD